MANPELSHITSKDAYLAAKQLPENWTAKELVAYHEVGHKIALIGAGGTFISYTAEPKGNVRGQTNGFIQGRDELDTAKRNIAALEGSLVAEERCGIEDHSGCGHDQAIIDTIYNSIALKYGQAKAEAIKAEGKWLGREIVKGVAMSDIIREGQTLANEPIPIFINQPRLEKTA